MFPFWTCVSLSRRTGYGRTTFPNGLVEAGQYKNNTLAFCTYPAFSRASGEEGVFGEPLCT